MEKLHRAATEVVESIAAGLAQIVGFGMVEVASPVPRRTDADALQGDWAKVGRDMSRGMDIVRRRAGR